jgi:hypothetical protein
MPFLHGVREIVVKDKAVPRTQKGWTFRKRRRAKPEGNTGIRSQGSDISYI